MKKLSWSTVDYLRTLFANPKLDGLSDSELLRHYIESETGDSFVTLLRRHGPMVLSLARRIVRDQHVAEDVFQAAFIILSRKARSVRKKNSLPAWLHSVAFRLALRAKKTRRLEDAPCQGVLSSGRDPLDDLTAREFLTILDEELNNLPEKYRLPIILCQLEGLSREEAAQRLGWPIGSLKARLERGRERLRVRLTKRGLASGAAITSSLQFGHSVLALPPALVQSTVRAALTGQAASAGAVALVNGAVKMMLVAKVQKVCLAAMLVGAMGWGAGWLARAGGTTEQENGPAAAPVAAVNQEQKGVEKRVDLYGDPLPEGAVMRLGTVRLRAAGANLALSPDGKTLVGVTAGKYISFWDVESGKLKDTCQVPLPSTNLSALSPDGRLLTQGSATGSLEVWEVETPKLLHKLADREAFNLWIGPVFSPDGKQLAAGWLNNDDHEKITIHVWDVTTGKQTFKQTVRSGGGGGMGSFSPDGQKLFIAFNPSDKVEGAYLFEIATGKQLWHAKDFYSASFVVFTPDGRVLSENGARDLATGGKVAVNGLPRLERGRPLSLTPDGRTLLFESAEGIHLWDLKDGRELRVLAGAGHDAMLPLPTGGNMIVNNVLLTSDSKSLITNNGSLHRWDLSTGKRVYLDNFDHGHNREVSTLVFTEDGKHLASGGDDGTVRYWDATTGRPIHVWMGEKPIKRLSSRSEQVNAIDMTPDGRWIILADNGGRLRVWDTVAGKLATAIALPTPAQSGDLVYHLRIRPDGLRAVGLLSWILPFGPPLPGKRGIAAIPDTDWLTTWDLKSGKLLAKAPVGTETKQSSALSPDGKMLATSETLVRVGKGPDPVHLEDRKSSLPLPTVFSRDGSLLAGGITKESPEHVHLPAGVYVWDAASGKSIARLDTKSYPAQLLFYPGNRLLAVNDHNGIQMWDIATETVVGKLNTIDGPRMNNPLVHTSVSSLAFTPDGRRLATGHPDGQILLWDVNLPAPKPVRLAVNEIDLLWADLKDADAAKAWKAVWRIADAAEDVVPFMRTRLKAVAPAAKEVTQPLLADLDSDAFARREAASKRLLELGVLAESALRARLKDNPSLETRLRLEALLKTIVEAPQTLSAETLRDLRAVAVLARMTSADARAILESLASGAESARLTEAARAALGR